MKQYATDFVEKHGERIFWLLIVTALAVVFLQLDGMHEAGKTFLIAVATLALNKARSPKDKGEINGDIQRGNRQD